jgi:hypothetical protein
VGVIMKRQFRTAGISSAPKASAATEPRYAAIRTLETRLLDWPGVSKETLTRARPTIERMLAALADAMSAGKPSRRQVRDVLVAIKQHAGALAVALGNPVVAPMMPEILGRLGWKECPFLETIAKRQPEYFDRAWWSPSFISETVSAQRQDLEHIASNAARQISLIPSGGGRNSITDLRAAPGPHLACAVAAIELIEALCDTRPERSSRKLSAVCRALWQAAGGDAAEEPSWKHLVRRVLGAAPGSRDEMLMNMVRIDIGVLTFLLRDRNS